jgi:hypothetical protein
VIADLFVRWFYYRRPLGRLVRCGSYGHSKSGIDSVTAHIAGRSWHFQRWETGHWKVEGS